MCGNRERKQDRKRREDRKRETETEAEGAIKKGRGERDNMNHLN